MPQWTEKDNTKIMLSDEEIIRDLKLLKPFTNRIRLYSAEDSAKVMPAVKKLGMQAHMGLWLSGVAQDNEKEIALAKSIISEYHESLTSVIVGNEVLLRDDLSPDELIAHVRDFKEFTEGILKADRDAKEKAFKEELAKEKSRKVRAAKIKEAKAKAAKEKPHTILVTTAEIWNMWLLYPDLAQEVDIINIHILAEPITGKLFFALFIQA